MATLPALMQDLGNLQLRADMAQAALLAGLAFSNTKTALAHSLSHDITLQHGVPHGIACSFSLPLVLEMALALTRGRCRAVPSLMPWHPPWPCSGCRSFAATGRGNRPCALRRGAR